MKVLFLYNDSVHAWPLLRARDALASIGIELEACHERSAQSVVRYMSKSFDVLLIHQELVNDDSVSCGRPVVILERIDGAQLGASRKWIRDVAGVFKGYSLKPAVLHNVYRGRVLAHQLKAAGIRAANSQVYSGTPAPRLTDADLAKIHAFYGFGAYQKHERLWSRQIDFTSRRKHAVHFAGTVSYNGSEIDVHRKLAASVARSIGGIGEPGRSLRPDEYAATMLDSRAVLCPFGWGESAHRDYEAWLLGCVVIKPDCSTVDSWPDAYVPGVTYLPCKADWSDGPGLVDQVSRRWPDMRQIRERNRLMALESARPDKIAERFKTLLEKVL